MTTKPPPAAPPQKAPPIERPTHPVTDPDLDTIAALRRESEAFTTRLLDQTAALDALRPRCTCKCACGAEVAAKQLRAEEKYAAARRVSDEFHRTHLGHAERGGPEVVAGLGLALARPSRHVVVASALGGVGTEPTAVQPAKEAQARLRATNDTRRKLRPLVLTAMRPPRQASA